MEMNPKIYIETSVISYLTAWRSRDLVVAANQEATREWWDEHSKSFELYISETVIQEAAGGDEHAAGRRLEIINEIAELNITHAAQDLAKGLLSEIPLPKEAEIDGLHIAIATVHGMDYLLTWNCRHIANAVLRHPIESVCRKRGYEPPVICTPLELME